jgi:hypothetical protein
MSIPPYQLGFPPDGSFLGQTKTTIRNNLDGTFLTLAVDHINNNGQPGMQPAGYHKAIHMVQQTPPTAVPNVGEIWCSTANDGYSTDTIFFQKTGLNLNAQMSRNFAPVAAANGYTFIPGGLVLQWGSTTAVQNSSSTTVTFPIAFTANVFSVQLTVQTDDNSTIRLSLLNTPTLTQFTTSQTSSTHFTKLYWMAIGN